MEESETQRWASLMPELVDRIANLLLDAADVDCYMTLRAVCHSWRAATADPGGTLDPRFRPRGWVMLDYPSHGVDARLLVNTATGRFHGRRMPILRAYFVVSVTADGLLVLAARDPPHAACVLHPFTGHVVRFAARMRAHVLAAAVSGSSPPYLVLYCQDTMKLYRASPDSKEFIRYKKRYAYPLVRKAVQGLVAVDGHQGHLPPLPAALVAKIADLMSPFNDVPADVPAEEIDTASWKRCFVVESAGETLVVFKLESRVEVFKMDMAASTLERIKSIGSRAIFAGGCHRCVCLDADKFPSIEANCVYFTDRLGSESTDVYQLSDGEQCESVVMSAATGDAPSVNLNLPAFLCHPMTAHPFTIIQLLSIYTFNMQSGQVTQVVEEEDRILEKLRTGEMSFSDLLRSCQADSDADD
uniref:KIB1-4 beta-propeller domain-containing protein n=1 Tax=Aegilops tauschii subsp. strangulata TaxID=200361 RepID=A0A453M377_AEGTS